MGILGILLLFAALSSTLALTRFGCQFKDNTYTLNKENEHPFSNQITTKLEFQNEADFWTFYNKVDAIMSREVKSMVYNTLEPFLTMLEEYNGSFKDFYDKYIPTYPLVAEGDDGIATLMKVYEKIIEVDDRVQPAFVLGAKALGVTEQFAENLAKKNIESPGEIAPAEFQPEELVGIIRILIAGKHDGAILLDINNPKSPTPVVMADSTLPFNMKHEIISTFKMDYTYSPDYITIRSHDLRTIKTSNKTDDYKERTDILYTARSLCDFLKTSVKKSLLNPNRGIVKFTSEGEIEGFLKVDVINENLELYSRRFNLIAKYKMNPSKQTFKFRQGFGIVINLSAFQNDSMIWEEYRYLLDLQSLFNIKENKLEDKLKQFHKAVNTGDIKEAFKQL